MPESLEIVRWYKAGFTVLSSSEKISQPALPTASLPLLGLICCHDNGHLDLTYRLHQDVVLAKKQRGSGILMQGFHVLSCPHQRAVVHAATGLPLLNLFGDTQKKEDEMLKWLSYNDELTRAGLLEGESCLQWPLWIRCLCTSSSADGSVQKWSAVLTWVYSNAQGPTVRHRQGTCHKSNTTPQKKKRESVFSIWQSWQCCDWMF